MKNPNEPKLDQIKLIPTVKLWGAKKVIDNRTPKTDPLIRLLKNDTPR